MNKVRIMHVVQSLDIGGLEKLVADSVRFFNRDRFHFIVCCLSGRGVLADDLEGNGIETVFLNKGFGIDFGISFRIAYLIRSKRIDILHTHNQRPQFYGCLALAINRTKASIHTKHGRDEPDNFKSLMLARFFSLASDRVVPVSADIFRFCVEKEKIPKHKVRLIRNGIDFKGFGKTGIDKDSILKSLGLRSSDLIVGTVGRLTPIKNQALLIEAFRKLKDKRDGCKLVIIGDGPLRDELIRRVNDFDMKSDVVFTGARRDIPDLLSIMDLFVLSSLSEGGSLVLLEAMAAGLPIVATDVGGNSEAIKDGENGSIVRSNDSSALSLAIEKILWNKDLRNTISLANRKKAQEVFDIRKMCEEYEKLYESVLKKARA